VVVALASTLHLQLRGGLGRTRSDLRDVRDELTATSAELSVVRDADQRAVDDLETTSSSIALNGRRLRRTATRLSERTAERDWLRARFEGTSAELTGAREDLFTTALTSRRQGDHINDLEACLAGVSKATDRRAVDDGRGAVLYLESVSAPCKRAESGVASPGAEAPAFAFDFADPYVLRVGDTYYAYATNGGGGNIQLIRSSDLGSWTWVGDALSQLPSWAAPHLTWAPAVLRRGSTYLLYYTARERATGTQCISFASAPSPAGPFVDRSSSPFLCQRDLGGSIDPSVFVDGDGAAYLTWKSEGETVGGTAQLWASRLHPSGLALRGPAQPLVRADQGWESRTIEGPALVGENGAYYLLYSGNSWNSDAYGIGYARCSSPLGPCVKPRVGPVITSHGTAVGPGGQEVVRDGAGRLWLTFHAWTEPNVGYPNRRTLRVERLNFANGTPALAAP
jgi:Glycosyl hydrolases family 43